MLYGGFIVLEKGFGLFFMEASGFVLEILGYRERALRCVFGGLGGFRMLKKGL